MFELMFRHAIWRYLSETQKDLIKEGNYLARTVENRKFKDYSFLVFPYAKAYEGYLKQLFLDVEYISHLDYISDHFRLGKYLSPHLIHRLQERSIYAQIRKNSTEDMAREIWEMWNRGRNQVFHYYPHNLRRIELHEAHELNEGFIRVMIAAFEQLRTRTQQSTSSK